MENSLEQFLGMLIKTNQDFSKRTVKMHNGTISVTVTLENDVEFNFENSQLRYVRNNRVK